MYPHLCGYTLRLRTEETGKKFHLPVPPGRHLNLLSQLLPVGLISNKSASRQWLWFFPLGHWQVLAHPQLLGPTKNKECIWDKGYLGWADKVHPLHENQHPPRRSPTRLTLFYLLHRNQQKVKENEDTKEHVPLKIELDKSSKTDLSETEISH